jgi:alpha-ketoglutarate-dependent taurine dioxygenase
MKTIELNNATEVSDIDLQDDAQCVELGRQLASDCVAVIRQSISEKRLYEIQSLWGQPSRALLHKYVGEQRLSGAHWRKMLLNLGYITDAIPELKTGMSRVSFAKNKIGKPTGIFANGELDWHSDQQSHEDSQRMIGLMSLWGSENSRTDFLCTAKAYEALNAEDRSMVDELYCVWNWDGGSMSADLVDSQMEIVRYNMVPLADMECPLRDQTASGVKGIKFPSHCFSHFRGMSVAESSKFKAYLWDRLNRPEYIYEHNWVDGEIVFMDQNITLHRRPTNIKDGNTRTMARMIGYLDNLFPGHGPRETIRVDGKEYGHDDFSAMVNAQRLEEYQAQFAEA